MWGSAGGGPSPEPDGWPAVSAELVAQREEAQRRRALALTAEARAARAAGLARDPNAAPQRPPAVLPEPPAAGGKQGVGIGSR